jgi:hypothetical protein
MRGRFDRVGRGLVAAAVVAMLAAPVQALPKDDDRWSMPRLVKVIKKLVVRTFGDGLIVPRP